MSPSYTQATLPGGTGEGQRGPLQPTPNGDPGKGAAPSRWAAGAPQRHCRPGYAHLEPSVGHRSQHTPHPAPQRGLSATGSRSVGSGAASSPTGTPGCPPVPLLHSKGSALGQRRGTCERGKATALELAAFLGFTPGVVCQCPSKDAAALPDTPAAPHSPNGHTCPHRQRHFELQPWAASRVRLPCRLYVTLLCPFKSYLVSGLTRPCLRVLAWASLAEDDRAEPLSVAEVGGGCGALLVSVLCGQQCFKSILSCGKTARYDIANVNF